MIALDASALLAFMFREEGHEKVAAVIDDSCLSKVNLAEVIARFVRDGHDPRVGGGAKEIVLRHRCGLAVGRNSGAIAFFRQKR